MKRVTSQNPWQQYKVHDASRAFNKRICRKYWRSLILVAARVAEARAHTRQAKWFCHEDTLVAHVVAHVW